MSSAAPNASGLRLSALRRQLVQTVMPYCASESQAVVRNMLCDFYDVDFTHLMMMESDVVEPGAVDTLMSMAQRIAGAEPLQYVTGCQYFCGLRFHVEPGVLIPRPETEELVDWVVADAQAAPGGSAMRVLDIGTGSGCIAVSIAHRLGADARVSAVDVSADALRIASANAQRLCPAVSFEQCDVLAQVPQGGPYDVVVSNPPYVCQAERADMSRHVLDHEPELALFVPDADPLLFYRRIALLCQQGLLRSGGRLYFEINEAYGPQTVHLLEELGFCHPTLRQDFTGRHRMVMAVGHSRS